MLLRLLFFGFNVLLYFPTCKLTQTTKIWKYNNNVLNKENWDKEASKDCSGLEFPKSMDSIFTISSINVSKIVLPIHGRISLEKNTVISFTSNNDCIKIKDQIPKDWFNPLNWDLQEENRAVPDLERIPCTNDVVVFPNPSFNVFFPAKSTNIAKLVINKQNFTSKREFVEYLDTEMGAQFHFEDSYGGIDGISITGNAKTDEKCQDEDQLYYRADVCKTILEKRQEDVECDKPLNPYNHCGLFCGAMLISDSIKHNLSDTKRFLNFLNNDECSYHISKIKNDKYQLLITDKERYSGNCLKGAELAFNYLKQAGATALELSGIPLFHGNSVKNSFSIIFGTLFAALIIMSAVYYMYIGPGKHYNINSTLGWTGNYLRPFYFARFENRDEGDVQFAEEVQEESSEQQRSFDNPMYGAPTPLVAKRSDSIATTATDISLENPLYTEMEEQLSKKDKRSEKTNKSARLSKEPKENYSEEMETISKQIEEKITSANVEE